MIRPATMSDLPEARALWDEWWKEEPTPGWKYENLMLLQERIFTDVVEGKREGICLIAPGAGVLLWLGLGKELHGYGVYVWPSFRLKGIGDALIEAAARTAKALGFVRVIVTPYSNNEGSLRWLQQCDFRCVQIVMVREF
jgi:GNAT superfamily N-acetyltransferase